MFAIHHCRRARNTKVKIALGMVSSPKKQEIEQKRKGRADQLFLTERRKEEEEK